MILQKVVEGYLEDEANLQRKIDSAIALGNMYALGDLVANLGTSQATKWKTQEIIDRKTERLGLPEQENLKAIAASEFLRLRLNALALKTRLRQRLRERRFELARLEQSYRNAVNGELFKAYSIRQSLTTAINTENNLATHIQAATKRRDSTLSRLARMYNENCDKLQSLKAKGQAQGNAVVPEKLDTKGLYELDVDHPIWIDAGFDDETPGEIPRWLSDTNVREGIRFQLELDRCVEEEKRLSLEAYTLQEWFREEWNVVNAAVEREGEYIECWLWRTHNLTNLLVDEDMTYQLRRRRIRLVYLYMTWESTISLIPRLYPISLAWGPTIAECEEAMAERYYEEWKTKIEKPIVWDGIAESTETAEFDEDVEDDELPNEDDGELMEEVEAQLEREAYRELGQEILSYDDIQSELDAERLRTPFVKRRDGSPSKRKRTEENVLDLIR